MLRVKHPCGREGHVGKRRVSFLGQTHRLWVKGRWKDPLEEMKRGYRGGENANPKVLVAQAGF